MVKLNGKDRQQFIGKEVELIGTHPYSGLTGFYAEDRPLFAAQNPYPFVEIKTKKGKLRTPVILSKYWRLKKS